MSTSIQYGLSIETFEYIKLFLFIIVIKTLNDNRPLVFNITKFLSSMFTEKPKQPKQPKQSWFSSVVIPLIPILSPIIMKVLSGLYEKNNKNNIKINNNKNNIKIKNIASTSELKETTSIDKTLELKETPLVEKTSELKETTTLSTVTSSNV